MTIYEFEESLHEQILILTL